VGTPTAPHPILKKYYEHEGARQPFVTALFDSAARYYDRSCVLGSLGSGQFYRGWVLRHYGLTAGMKLLDVATGTGLVARAATKILVEPGAVIGLDPSIGMLREGQETHSALMVQGTVEELPFGDDGFDFLSMGYALRHVADLRVAFAECLRVLKPGGRLLVLEISRPRSVVGRWLARAYFDKILPPAMQLLTGSVQAKLLMKYHWDTIVACVPPEAILDVLRTAGFVEVKRRGRGGVLSEYLGLKPAPSRLATDPAATLTSERADESPREGAAGRRAQRVAPGITGWPHRGHDVDRGRDRRR
jgi:demethylmenaquinone methyltransferase / 2-methoxy-6-polyprenyl-1,4-benzoquinol methylase